jgi:hypothetical protein
MIVFITMVIVLMVIYIIYLYKALEKSIKMREYLEDDNLELSETINNADKYVINLKREIRKLEDKNSYGYTRAIEKIKANTGNVFTVSDITKDPFFLNSNIDYYVVVDYKKYKIKKIDYEILKELLGDK